MNTNLQKQFLRPTNERMKQSSKARAADHLYAQSLFSLLQNFTPFSHHKFNDEGRRLSLDKLLQGNHGLT